MPNVHTPLPELDERDRGDVIVLADPSVDGEDSASILRARGFTVFDVPLALLEARVASESPAIIIVDIDQPGAIEQLLRARGGDKPIRPHLFCLGDPLRAAELPDVSLTESVFERPVDVQRLVERAVSVASPAAVGFGARGTTPPPMYPARPSQSVAPAESIPPISELPHAKDGLEVGSFLDEGADPAGSLGILAGGNVRLSPELARQIGAAEARIRAEVDHASSLPAPSDEADAPVPADLLAQLDEPLDASDDLEGTGGIGALLNAPGSSPGSSVSVVPSAFTPAPRMINAPEPTRSRPGLFPREGGDGSQAPTGAGTRTQGLSDLASAAGGYSQGPSPATSVREPQGSTSVPQLQPQPTSLAHGPRQQDGARDTGLDSVASITHSARAGSPALGIRLGELLGLRPEDLKRPDATMRGATSTAAFGTSPNVEGALAAPPATSAQSTDAASLFPISPPVRFQEPRDIAQGRAVVDLRTVPPPARPTTDVARGASPIVIPPSTGVGGARPATDMDVDRGVSPAAQSVHPTRAATSAGETAGALIFGEGDGFKALAKSIATRKSGCASFLAADGARRIVLMDGDLVTATSEIADESLVAFLAARGDIDRDVAARLAGKLPGSGRHAGAALIAQGYLAQDDLWPVLRAHAEHLIGKILLSGPGSLEIEEEVPGRLKAEPNVFGGATGAEVYVETARRVFDPARAREALGASSRLDNGARPNLLSECALSSSDEARVRSAPGKTVAEACDGAAPELASVLRALVELDVLAVLAPVRPVAPRRRDEPDPIDEDAVRGKVRAKMALVQEGDYFSLLGVARDATSYEIKRAFLELRRTFEPSRLLSAQTVDLHDDVTLILEVVEEAFDILRDDRRRDRYRRAIEAGPPS